MCARVTASRAGSVRNLAWAPAHCKSRMAMPVLGILQISQEPHPPGHIISGASIRAVYPTRTRHLRGIHSSSVPHQDMSSQGHPSEQCTPPIHSSQGHASEQCTPPVHIVSGASIRAVHPTRYERTVCPVTPSPKTYSINYRIWTMYVVTNLKGRTLGKIPSRTTQAPDPLPLTGKAVASR